MAKAQSQAKEKPKPVVHAPPVPAPVAPPKIKTPVDAAPVVREKVPTPVVAPPVIVEVPVQMEANSLSAEALEEVIGKLKS